MNKKTIEVILEMILAPGYSIEQSVFIGMKGLVLYEGLRQHNLREVHKCSMDVTVSLRGKSYGGL